MVVWYYFFKEFRECVLEAILNFIIKGQQWIWDKNKVNSEYKPARVMILKSSIGCFWPK